MCVALTSSTTPSGLITTVPDPNPVVPTVVAPSGSCRSDEFQCDDGSCVGRDFRCDNVPDCGDASDEDNCNISRFPLSMFISLSLCAFFLSFSSRLTFHFYLSALWLYRHCSWCCCYCCFFVVWSPSISYFLYAVRLLRLWGWLLLS